MKWPRIMVWFLIGSLFIGAAVLLIRGEHDGAGAVLFSALAASAMSYFVFRPHLLQDALAERLDNEELRVSASILSVSQTSTYLNEVPVMRVKLKYVAGGREPIKDIRQPVAYQALASLQRGNRISIRVDPKRTEQFVMQL